MKKFKPPAYPVLLITSLLTVCRLEAQVPSPAGPSSSIKESIPPFPVEEVYLHIDRDKYIAGEDIWFSIYTLEGVSGKLSSGSVVAYVELLNPLNMPVIQKRLKVSEGRGAGNFAIPDSVSSGTYTIRAYTNWMKNFLPDNCFASDIEVVNPFRDTGFIRKKNTAGNFNTARSTQDSGKTNALALTVDSIFGRREKVMVRLAAGNTKAGQADIFDLSVSVAPAEASSDSQGIDEYLRNKETAWKDILSGINYHPEYRFESDGHYLSVSLKYREEEVADSSDYLYMSIQGKVAEFRYAGREPGGLYSFLMPADNKLRNLILQPEHADRNMIIKIEPSFPWVFPPSDYIKDTLNESDTEVFTKLSFNYQAARIYGISYKKEAETTDEINPRKRRFYGIPEMEIYLDDYISLPSMQEVFFELLPGINIRTRKSGYVMQITNPMTGADFNEPPLIMIDGVIINDLNLLVDLNPELVEKIEVVKTPYLIGDLILYGIVNVITKSGDFSNSTMPDYAVILPYRVVEKPAMISLPDYSDEKQRSGRKPDLRNTLYWNPSVKTGINGEAEIEFWASDLPGSYVIDIQGISETGQKVSLQKSFTVRTR
jgi:hypothetical protein